MKITAVVEEIAYVTSKKNRFGNLDYIQEDRNYKLKFKLRKKQADEWYAKFQKFAEKEKSFYEWIEMPDDNYPEYCVSGCLSKECYLGEDHHCWCGLFSVFLQEEGFDFVQRQGNEEIRTLDTNKINENKQQI